MKKKIFRTFTAVLASAIILSGEVVNVCATNTSTKSGTVSSSMTDKQLSSLSMLNYITVLSQSRILL